MKTLENIKSCFQKAAAIGIGLFCVAGAYEIIENSKALRRMDRSPVNEDDISDIQRDADSCLQKLPSPCSPSEMAALKAEVYEDRVILGNGLLTIGFGAGMMLCLGRKKRGPNRYSG